MATTWYNYVLASAGTITDEDTTSSSPATNVTPATESICPKGWTLPSKTQVDGQRDMASFHPLFGGEYYNGALQNEDTRGGWWGSTAYEGYRRYTLHYDGSKLYTNKVLRYRGFSIRCINKQKTVLDLTYMQEMTPEIASSGSCGKINPKMSEKMNSLEPFAIVSRRDAESEKVADKIRERLVSLGYTEDLENPSGVIVVGGDGSFLYAVHKYLNILDKAVFVGMHTGTLGFFMDYRDSELEEFISDITQGNLPIEEYPILEISAGDKTYHAVNEMRLENIFRTQTVGVYLDGEKFEDFRGTGLLVSTQLGSTAYNRSLGGAVLQKGLPVLELTEIAGIHHRAYRSLGSPFVVSDKTVITLDSDSFDKAKLGFDSEIAPLDNVESITIRRSDARKLRIMRGKKIPYFERIRQLF